MAKYIDTDIIVNGFREAVERMRPNDNTKEIIDIFCESLQNEPTADVVEVKHGEWIANLIKPWNGVVVNWKCSVCEGISSEYGNYCLHCGAQMDGRRDT